MAIELTRLAIVTKVKQDLIHKAKVKKAYAKVKAEQKQGRQSNPQPQDEGEGNDDDQPQDGQQEEPGADGEGEKEGEQLHPTRQLMLKDEAVAQHGEGPSDGHRRRTRRPGYYDKQLKKAEQKKVEDNERAAEFQRRREERERKIAERDRYKRAMAKTIGRDGKKKLGRESTLLLDKVKRMVSQ